MIVLSPNLVLLPTPTVHADAPMIGRHNVVNIDNIEAGSAQAGWPVLNLANVATDLEWRAANTDEQLLTITPGGADDIDYAGLARPNFGTAGIAVSLEGNDGEGWSEIVPAFVPPDDRPIIALIPRAPYAGLRWRLATGSVPAVAAVAYAGRATRVPRRIYVGHEPLTYARRVTMQNRRSHSGRMLGSLIVGESHGTQIAFQNIEPDWMRENLAPLIEGRDPFFWAWRPGSYPREVGFVEIVGNPNPSNQRPNGMMEISFNVEGEA